ncbi:hypothetical protein FJZ53_01630 [Candidatus Woesearchaeota archaeon]|nr:hypothetical protein [Candidatus Woesearchaeota archaeon]
MSDGQDLAFVLNDLNARIRVLENKYSLFGERLLIVNQNMIEEYKKLMRNIKGIEEDLKEIKSDLHNVKEIVNGITKEMSIFARKDSLQVLEKYINLWNPMNFVTDKDVNNLIQHSEYVVLKEDLLNILNSQKREILEAVKKELEAKLSAKQSAGPIKQEGGKDGQQ